MIFFHENIASSMRKQNNWKNNWLTKNFVKTFWKKIGKKLWKTVGKKLWNRIYARRLLPLQRSREKNHSNFFCFGCASKNKAQGPIPETMTLDVACDIPCEMKIAIPEFISHATITEWFVSSGLTQSRHECRMRKSSPLWNK